MRQTTLFLLFFLFGLFASKESAATHVIAYDGYATCLAETQDSITLRIEIILYRDEAMSTVEFDADIRVGMYPNQANGSLIQTWTLLKKKDFVMFPGQINLSGIRQGEYSFTLSLPKTASGYTFVYQRCCFSTVMNSADDQGFDLRIEIPAGMVAGDKTPSIIGLPAYFIQSGKRYAFPHSVQQSVYDSVSIAINSFYIGGADSDPVPNPAANLAAVKHNIFRAGFSAQNPLGATNTCDYTSEPDSLILQVSQNGDYFLPLTLRCYKDGLERVYSRIIRLKVTGFPITYLNLALVGSTWSTVDLRSNTMVYSQDDLVLERGTDTSFNSFVEVKTGISYGMGVDLSDGSLEISSPLYYRLKLNSTEVQYSNRVEVLPTGLRSIGGPNSFPLYPNPADRIVYIELLETSAYTLYSSKGELLREGMLEEGGKGIPVHDIPTGIYLLRINGLSQRLIITH